MRPSATNSARAFLAFGAFFAVFFLPAENGRLMASGDALFESLPAFLGQHHLWEPAMLLGYPLYADPNQQLFYPFAWLGYLPHTYNVFAIAPFVLGAWAMCGFVRCATGEAFAGIVAGLTYALGGFMISHAGHLMISHPAAWAPFVFWAIEVERRRSSVLALALGACALALCAVSGQPEIFAFTLLLAAAYAVVNARSAMGGGRAFLARVAASLVLGIGLASVQLIPEAVLGHASTRSSIALGAYTLYEIPALQIAMRAVFPYALGTSTLPGFTYSHADLGTFTEETIAVGVVALVLALIASAEFLRDRRIAFWAFVAFAALLLAVGDATPLATITHALPVYGLLRAPGRHAFEWTFAVAVLAGYGTRALVRGRVSTKRLSLAYAIVAAFVAVAYFEFTLGGDSLASYVARIYAVDPARIASPLSNGALGIPLAVAIVGATLVAIARRRTTSRTVGILVVLAVVIDAGTFAWPAYWNWAAIDSSALIAPPFATALSDELARDDTRIAWSPGNLAPALAPNLTTLWNVPTVDGYTPLIPERDARLLDVTPSGGIPLPRSRDLRLDLAGASILALPSVAGSAVTFDQPFAADDLHIFFRTRDDTALSSVGLALARPMSATAIAMVSELGDSVDVVQNTTVANLTIVFVDGGLEHRSIVAGRDTSEFAYDRPDVRARVRHARVAIYSSIGVGHTYRTLIPIASYRPIRRIEIAWTYPSAALTLDKLSLVDAHTRTAEAFDELAGVYAAPNHWRPMTIDSSITAFRNETVMPRAWFARPLKLDAAATLQATRFGVLPNGTAFDPRRDALVEDAVVASALPTRTSVRVTSSSTSEVEATTDCSTRCFLIVRDAFNPDWQTSIDGVASPTYATDIALRGVALTAGAHRVRFRFVPRPLYYGLGVSIVSALVMLTLIGLAARARFALRHSIDVAHVA